MELGSYSQLIQDLRIKLQRMLKQHGGHLYNSLFQEDNLLAQLQTEIMKAGNYSHMDLYDFKYEEIEMIRYKQIEAQKISDKEISEEIKATSIKFFKEMKMRSYARVDIRMNAQNEIYREQRN